MSPQSPRPDSEPRTGLSFTQMAASAGAASSAAFAASYLGVTGTIIGAAVASVIATVATSMYAASLQRSREAVRRRAVQLAPLPWTPAVARSATRPNGLVPDPRAPGPAANQGQAPDLGPNPTQVLPPVPVDIAPEPPRDTGPSRPGIRWGRVLPAAAAVLAITLGTLTAVEGALGRPLASLFGGDETGRTSLGSIAGSGGPAQESPQESPQPTPTPTAEPTAEPTTEPTDEPTSGPTDEPTDGPTEEPTDGPTDGPTEEPTGAPTGAPTGPGGPTPTPTP